MKDADRLSLNGDVESPISSSKLIYAKKLQLLKSLSTVVRIGCDLTEKLRCALNWQRRT